MNIDFGNIQQVLEQQEINERFRSIGRMMTRLKLRIDRLEVKLFSCFIFLHRNFFFSFLANRRIKFSPDRRNNDINFN